MDDRNFDQRSAQEWIDLIEGPRVGIRERDFYPRIRSWLKSAAPTDVLEIGSGQGVCSTVVNLPGYAGIEPSPFLLARAREIYPSARFVEGNAYAIPFQASAFDAAFSVTVWHLLSDVLLAAREMARVLRPGGAFLIITANPAAPVLWAENQRDVLYLHSQEKLRVALEWAGLTLESTETFRPAENRPEMHYYSSIQGRRNAE